MSEAEERPAALVPSASRSSHSPAETARARHVANTHTDRIELALARASLVQARYNPFAKIDFEGARIAARMLDEASAAEAGPLAGVAVSVKDILDVAGLPTRWGSRLFRDAAPARSDLAAVARLRASGAVVLAKTTTSEFAHAPLGYSPLEGLTKNPWNEAVTAGGSSSGAGVAVATGVTPVAVATDAGCSTRLPATCTGTFGLKPTLGLAPHERVPEGFGNFVHLGLIAQTVVELQRTLPVISGGHPLDPQGLGRIPPQLLTGNILDGARVVVWRTVGNRTVSGEIDVALERAMAVLGSLGANVMVEDCPLPNPDPTWSMLQEANWAARFAGLGAADRALLSPSLLAGIDRGLAASAVDLQRAQVRRTAIFREVQQVFLSRADFILTPASAARPVAAGHGVDEPLVIDGAELGSLRTEWIPYLSLFDLSGHPAIALPAGLTADRVPLGVQLVGPWMGDHALLAAARQFEAALPPLRLPS